jgi:hypothetical protein
VRYDKTCLLVFMYSTCYSCQTLIKLEFSRHNLEKYSNIKFYKKKLSGGSRAPCGRTGKQTGRHDEANRHVSHFVNAHKNGRNLRIASSLLYSYISHTYSSIHSHVHITISMHVHVINNRNFFFLMFKLHCQL